MNPAESRIGGRTEAEWIALLAVPGWGNTAREALVKAAFGGLRPPQTGAEA